MTDLCLKTEIDSLQDGFSNQHDQIYRQLALLTGVTRDTYLKVKNLINDVAAEASSLQSIEGANVSRDQFQLLSFGVLCGMILAVTFGFGVYQKIAATVSKFERVLIYNTCYHGIS